MFLWSFQGSLPGVPPISSGFGAIAHPYVQVSITYPVSLSFTKLVSSSSTFNMSAKASCGLNPVALPIPLLVLHHTASAAVSVGGTAAINILGGPNRSIQVNSSSATAVSVGTVNLSQAGPSGTGGDFAVFGGPSTKPAGVNVGTTGHWVVPASPVGDPWVIVAAMSVRRPGRRRRSLHGEWCPDPVGCVEFTGGNYAPHQQQRSAGR
jgi:hypothetical protein